MMFHCPGCKAPRDTTGSGVRLFFQTPTLVCIGCKERMRKPMKKPKQGYVATGGKAIKTVGNPKFTSAHSIKPSVVKGYPGYHVQIQCSPAEVKRLKTEGYYAKEWNQLRGK